MATSAEVGYTVNVPGPIPVTGSDTLGILGAGLILVVTGVALRGLARRERQNP